QVYDEDRWTVGKHSLHVLLVLFCISAGNQAVLVLTNNPHPPFWQMYLTVTVIGFFPTTLGLFLAERRRLKRNLAHAQTLNAQLDRLHRPAPVPAAPVLPKGVELTAENGKDKLSLLPNQLIYLESVGNYVEVHWLNMVFPQKTMLRNTLKEMERALRDHPQFFRCHRAFIVNLKAVNKTEGNARGYQLTMSGSGQSIPVSRGYVDAFDARMATLV
ncbi:MAG: LytTR family transcriptional regulator, partial [Bacteroidetes bacterium]|nr:LytTR family transcriptional regulator [Fibrella sp.]